VTKKKQQAAYVRAPVVARRDAAGRLLMSNGQPNPTGTGRYCMPPPGTCYCGGCPHWRRMPEPDYSKIEGSSSSQQARSWASRDSTWIDEL
jgi:hypothetical protein